MADFLDLCLQQNTTPNEDAEKNIIGADFDKMEIEHIRQGLLDDYGLSLDNQEILDLMEEYGLDFGMQLVGVSMHETLYSFLSS